MMMSVPRQSACGIFARSVPFAAHNIFDIMNEKNRQKVSDICHKLGWRSFVAAHQFGIFTASGRRQFGRRITETVAIAA
jgi:hypothetical protein